MVSLFRNIVLTLSLALPLSSVAQGTTQWRDIHKVKRHETIFGIARSYDITIDELLDANPEMRQKGYELKKGSQIFIPYSKTASRSTNSQTKTTSTNPQTSKTKSADNKVVANYASAKGQRVVRVGVLLPFLDHSSEGTRMIEYYRGVRAALDTLGKEGIKTEVNLWNINKDSVVSKVLTHNPSIASQDIILGPLYTSQVHPLAEFCRQHNVRLVMPFSIDADDATTNPNVFQIYQSDTQLSGSSIGAFIERFGRTHRPIFINCNTPSDGKVVFTKALREALQARGVTVELTNVNTPLRDFAKHFSVTQPNVIVLNSGAYKPLERVFSKLDSLKRIDPSLVISTYGYNEWFIYQPNLEREYFKYNVHIPTTYYFSRTSDRIEDFERDYKRRYGQSMNPDCLPRMALLGYDETMFFVRGIARYGKSFVGNDKQDVGFKPLQSRLEFKRLGKGGYQNSNFQLIRFKTDGTLDSLTY